MLFLMGRKIWSLLSGEIPKVWNVFVLLENTIWILLFVLKIKKIQISFEHSSIDMV